jgi:hypothetical protein
MKGFVELPMVMIIAIVAMISVFIFFTTFKVHVTNVFIDVDNLNRYQDVPTASISSHLAVGDEVRDAEDRHDPKRDLRPKEKINCFLGNGPAGKHGQISQLCTKRLPAFFTKHFNGIGGKTITGIPGGSEIGGTDFGLSAFRNNLKLALPQKCFSILLMDKPDGRAFESYPEDQPADCNFLNPKLEVTVPVPVMSGKDPAVAYEKLLIGTYASEGESFGSNWPKYRIEFVKE